MHPDVINSIHTSNLEIDMTEAAKLERIARHLQDQHARRMRFETLSGELGMSSLEEAYDAQQALIALWESGPLGRVGGYKIALTSKAIQNLVGLDEPCGAAIFASTMHSSPAEIATSDFVRLGLEFELAFRMGKDVPAGGGPYDAASIRDYVDTAMPAFELIEDRNADYSNLEALSLVADNAWCGGIVLGPPSAAWRELDLATTPVLLDYNRETEAATTGEAMGNPLNSLSWLANLLAGQGRSLVAGDVVMSGSTLATKFAKPGDHVIYRVDGLGAVELRVT
jgi:2-keto-4-pentenoate hydratase